MRLENKLRYHENDMKDLKNQLIEKHSVGESQ